MLVELLECCVGLLVMGGDCSGHAQSGAQHCSDGPLPSFNSKLTVLEFDVESSCDAVVGCSPCCPEYDVRMISLCWTTWSASSVSS